MIAEVLLVLGGHSSSLFPSDHTINPAIAPLLHPGEQQCLEALGLVANRYRNIKSSVSRLSGSRSRYVCALCATLNLILKGEYESLVVETEANILKRDSALVSTGSFVPLASIRAVFSEWDAPLAALASLMDELESKSEWEPGPLIDMLLARTRSGVYRVSSILSRLSVAVQIVWRTQMTALLVHGSLSPIDPLASTDYVLLEGSIPSCVSLQTAESIVYVGRAIGTVKAAKWQKQLPRTLASEHTSMLEEILPQSHHEFDRVIAQIRTNVSEWLWLNVLTQKDVEDAVDSLANYFLLRNGEFSLALIREIERLKISRLTSRAGATSMIREQDLNHALLRASLGTSAQHDPSISHLRFTLPLGPLRPLLPSLASGTQSQPPTVPPSSAFSDSSIFNTHLLGTPLHLTYKVSWPLDLFLHPSDLVIYGNLFSYLSALRKTHARVHNCWTSLSNAQRARRKWTGLGEGGTDEDLGARQQLLRCGWGAVRDMTWFLDTLMGYLMTDVVDVEYRRLRELLSKGGAHMEPGSKEPFISSHTLPTTSSQVNPSGSSGSNLSTSHLDFTTLRAIHATYLDRLLTGCLLSHPALTAIIRPILEVCERFVAQVERWGGDILPALLFEGSIREGGSEEIGSMVRERWGIVAEINQALRDLLETFYEQLSLSTSQQPFAAGADASKSIAMNASVAHMTTLNISRAAKNIDGGAAANVRRHVERLLLRLDFNGEFSSIGKHAGGQQFRNILAEGGLA